MDTNTIIEGTLKFRDGKKWKSRWCVLRKLSPVADCVHVQLYRDSKERYNNGQTKASLSLQYFLAVQSGFTLDKESNTIAILCEDVTVIFAFDTREQLIQWQAKIAINLGEDEQFLVQISSVPGRSKMVPGPALLHVLQHRFCLTDGVPPHLLGHWHIAHLRKYGVVDGRFCFEGGSQCGRGEGLHVLVTDQAEAVTRAFQAAAQGHTPLSRRATSTYLLGRERSISSSRTEANLCDRQCTDSRQLGAGDRSRSQENLCWTSPADWSCDVSTTTSCYNEGTVSRPRCRSCHIKLARSSTVTCALGSGFTWTMESSGGVARSPGSTLDHRHKSAPSSVRGVENQGYCFPPPRPPKTKVQSLDLESSLSKRPRPSPSMPIISRCDCNPYRTLAKDISSTAITEMGEDYYDTPRNFKKTVFEHCSRGSQENGNCLCRGKGMLSRAETHSAITSLSQAIQELHGKENRSVCHHEHNLSNLISHTNEEPTSLSSDPGRHPDSNSKGDTHSSCCCCYMNLKGNTLCQAKKCVKSVTFSDLPQNVLQQPNYVNIEFAESLSFYENCKDCYNKRVIEFEDSCGRKTPSRLSSQDICNSCSNCLRNLGSHAVARYPPLSHPPPDQTAGYIKMSSLANLVESDNMVGCSHGSPKRSQLFVRLKSKSSMCLDSAHKSPRNFLIKSISDPEINILPTNQKRSKIALSKIIDVIRNVRPVTGQEIQRHARKSSLPSYKNRAEESQYQSDDTLSSDTMVNTANDMSVKGSLNSLSSETTNQGIVHRFMSASELNISFASLNDFKSTKIEQHAESDLEKYKEHLRNLELPPLPSDWECNRLDNTCFSAVRRSCTLTFKPGHNRDSSSSNDSGVSTASLRLRRTDFTEFEMPVTTSLSAKLLREYALSQAGKSSSDLSLPRRSKSIDPLGELVFQFQEYASAAKSTSALLSAENGKEGKLLRFIDAPSTSSGTSDLSDYMDNLSISSYSSNDHPRSRCPATTLKPRSGKEYHKIDRLNFKPTEEGGQCSSDCDSQRPV